MSMDAQAVTGVARYGVERNPFFPQPLDPMNGSDEIGRDLGNLLGLEAVEAYIDRAAQAGETAFVLVQGRGGSGRTSICRHLLRYHCAAKGIDPDRFLIPTVEPGLGQDQIAILRCWIISLLNLVRRKAFPLGDSLKGELERAGQQDIQTFGVWAGGLLGETAETLTTSGSGYGVLFEGVKSYELIRLAHAAFGDSGALVVFSMLDYPRTHDSVRGQWERDRPHGTAVEGGHYPILQLTPVGGGEGARDFVDFHWRRARADVEAPFDPEGLVEAFADRDRPAGRIAALAHRLLDRKATAAGPGPIWPDGRADLLLGRDYLLSELPVIDQDLPEPFDRDA
jgi:hypothetical protein